MTVDPVEHGRRANAWRYGEGTMWGQTEVWITGGGNVVPVEELELSHVANIIRRIERANSADEIEGTPLMRRLRELHHDE